MDSLDYLEFKVEIGHGSGSEYPVAVTSPVGQAQAMMPFPFNEQILESYLEEIQFAPFGPEEQRNAKSTKQEQVVQVFGRALFDSLFTGEVLPLYDLSQQQGAEQGKGLRLKLQIHPSELVALPWELLYDSRQDEYLCLSPTTPIVRYVEQPEAIQPSEVTPPLRILGMIVGPQHLSGSDLEREKQRLEAATQDLQEIGLVETKWVEGKTWNDLRRALWSADWHVFYFAGDGGFDRESGEGYLILADDWGQSERLSAARLSRLLPSRKSLRLVSLNPLEDSQDEARDRFSSTATLLVQRGIPAALTMQDRLTERASMAFARTCYGALAATAPLDLAAIEARQAIRSEGGDPLEWGIPVLHTCLPDMRLFDREMLAEAACNLGDEALAIGAFARAIDRYRFAVEMGASPQGQERMELAVEARQTFGEAEAVLSERRGDAESQADAILKVIGSLDELEQRLPDGPAIHSLLGRTREAASELRDRLWKDGLRLLGKRAFELSLGRQSQRMQESVRLLEKAVELDGEHNRALKEDLDGARQRLSNLEDAQIRAKAERGRRWRTFAIIGAILAVVLILVFLIFGLARPPAFIAGITSRATTTTESAPVSPVASTIAVANTAVPTSIITSGPTPTQAADSTVPVVGDATATSGFTASPSPPSHTATPAPTPSSTYEPAATQTQTVAPTPPPTDTATSSPQPATPVPSPTLPPTASPTRGIVYPAPVLLQPDDIVFLSQEGDTLYTMRWEWDGELQPDEWFDVRIWRPGMPHHGVAWTKEPEYLYDICLKGNGLLYWTIAIIQGQDGLWEANLSPEAPPRRFSSSRSDRWCEQNGRWVQGGAQ